MEYTVAELSENALFVQILSKYPNIFRRPTTKSERTRQEYARYALTHTFNEKCKTNLSIRQVTRKVNNIKARLKEKHNKYLLGTKRVKFHDWEQLFFSLWTAGDKWTPMKGDASKLRNDETENMETSLQNELIPEDMCDSSEKPITKSPTTVIETSIETKIEPDINFIKEEDDIESISDISATPHWYIETEQQTITEQHKITAPSKPTEVQFNGIYNVYEQYEKMSMDELKRVALISQTKMFKAQEDAARAREKLNLYKLKILKQGNGSSFHHN